MCVKMQSYERASWLQSAGLEVGMLLKIVLRLATLARELKGGGLNWSTCQRQAYSAMLAPFSEKSATLGSSADASVIFPLRN